MGTTEYDNLSKEMAEGRGRAAAVQRSQLGGDSPSSFPILQRFVVLDVVFDPQIIDAKKIEYWEHDLGISNSEFAHAAPRNAIIARRVQSNTSSPAEQAMILYPLFPPNLSLPCKPGEHVWVMFEDPTGTRKDLGYWMCRIVTAGYAEDVNHTHPHRAHDSSFNPGTKDKFEGKTKPSYEFRNGSVGYQDGERFTVPETATIPGGDDAYPKLLQESDGGKLTHYEPAPRYRKRPDEYVLEGSNNTLIVMGRDRNSVVAKYEDDPQRGQVPRIPVEDITQPGAGKIDLVAGRGQTPTTGGTPVDNSLGHKELGKSASELVVNEGDPDFISDRSRILIAQKTKVDTNFELTRFNREFADGSSQGSAHPHVGITDDPNLDDGAIVVKSDRLRFIARSDVEILVTGFERDADGHMVETTDPDKYCAIVLKTNGDIVIRPALLGFIKLGGDDANLGVLCTDLPVVAQNGTVTGQPLLTTMGGMVGGSKPLGPGKNSPQLAKGQGKLASKVLIK